MKRYVPFASLGVLLALLLHAAIPAPPRVESATRSTAPAVAPVPDLDAGDDVIRSDAWFARHSIVPRARVERAPSASDGARIHAERPTGKRRR